MKTVRNNKETKKVSVNLTSKVKTNVPNYLEWYVCTVQVRFVICLTTCKNKAVKIRLNIEILFSNNFKQKRL